MKKNYSMGSVLLLATILRALCAQAYAYEPIILCAKDFSVASGTPTLQMWQKGALALPVWSLSGGQVGQSIVATTPPLPRDSKGVRVELLVVNNENSASNVFSEVYRVDLTELNEGEEPRTTEGKPVRNRLSDRPWQPRWIEIESFVVVRGGAPLVLRIRRQPEDVADTYERPAGLVQVRVTPLPSPKTANIVEKSLGYNSWPMIQSVGNRLVCTYSRGSGHTIGEGKRKALSRMSADGGLTWSPEVCFADDPRTGEVMIGKGMDTNGAALFWVRCIGQPKSHHDLYRTRDGVTFEKIAEPVLSPFPMQITDVFSVNGRLMALWFATDYREESNHSWGTLTSTDNGLTWTQKTVEHIRQKRDLPTEPCVVNLGQGRLLGLARTECGGDSTASQFQLTSTDGGLSWQKTRTNIRDICASSPSLIYERESGLLYNYYYERGRHVVKRRVVRADFIFNHPLDWPPPEGLAIGDEQRPWDAGNVNATALGGRHYLSYYSGNETNATVYVTSAEPR